MKYRGVVAEWIRAPISNFGASVQQSVGSNPGRDTCVRKIKHLNVYLHKTFRDELNNDVIWNKYIFHLWFVYPEIDANKTFSTTISSRKQLSSCVRRTNHKSRFKGLGNFCTTRNTHTHARTQACSWCRPRTSLCYPIVWTFYFSDVPIGFVHKIYRGLSPVCLFPGSLLLMSSGISSRHANTTSCLTITL